MATVQLDMFPIMELNPIQALEELLLSMPQADIKTTHTFFPGIYERKIVIPPWTVLTGAQHLTDYRVRVEEGTIAVNTDDGIVVLTAPAEFHVKAGIKRVGSVFEEQVVWVDIYDNPDNCKDLNVLEERLYGGGGEVLGENRLLKKLTLIQQDYQKFLEQMGMTQEQMDSIVKSHHDLIPMPAGADVELRPSRIHGTGLYALRAFFPGEVVCPGRLNGCRTPAGRFINHSPEPNVKPVLQGDDIYAVALQHIQENEEILVDYRVSMEVNFGIHLSGANT